MNTSAAPARALVLGGGGPAGASWEAALLLALTAAGLPAADADVIVGTSAGSLVGAWLTMDPAGLADVPELMRERTTWHAERAARGRSDRDQLTHIMTTKPDAASLLAVARAAVEAEPPLSAEAAEDLWKRWSPAGPWPRNLLMTALNLTTGEPRTWSASDALPVAVGIACSTAAPGIAPAVSAATSTWLDGGVRSATNADLVPGALPRGGKALIAACRSTADLDREATLLSERGFDVRIVVSEPYYDTPTDLIDPRFLGPATEAGTRQGREAGEELAKWWNES
ncbi:patatin-like phospholipase family protein [Amycolatopsis sp. NPDC004368]